MVFTSLNFLIFFPIVACAYFLTPAKYRWATLLFASYFFYINLKPVYALLLAGVTLSTYIFTLLIDGCASESRRKTYLILNILLILAPLFFFKYFDAFNEGIFDLLQLAGIRFKLPEITLILPVGISFYTFMAIGYTIDVYNDEIKAERYLGIVALFISFFPLILSGPIERAKNMIPQFRASRGIDFNLVAGGLKLMLWGYFMKLVVADRLGIYVDAVYNNIGQHNGTSFLLASLLYPFQVYTDLGGYSLIAIGAAEIMGFKVMNNFKRPFFAITMAEFWRRWHISLISWFMDYVYTPLTFTLRRYGIYGIVIALLITFMISGIWHGAALTFIVWGLMQGLILSIEALTNQKRIYVEKKFNLNKNILYGLSGIILTYLLFSASLIFGRAPDLSDAFQVFDKIFTGRGKLFIDPPTLAYSLFGLSMVLLKDFRDEFFPEKLLLFENKSVVIRFASYLIMLFMILLTGVLNGRQFIYFQF